MLGGNLKSINMVETSILILTKNAGDSFKQTLDKVFSQKYKNFEVLVIDSSSSDNTLEIARKYNLRIVKIKSEEFGHGKTRNLGVKLSKGKYIVFLTQDAIPNNNNWLSELINPLKNNKIVGVYSRQLPKENEKIIEKFFYYSLYPNKDKTWDWNKFSQGDNIFSDVSSAIRRETLTKYPYNNEIILAEDYDWAVKMLEQKKKIFYNSKSEVIHSHSYNLKQIFKRNFDIGVAYKTIYNNESKKKGFFKKGTKIFFNEIKYLVKHGKIYLIPYAVVKDMTKYIAVCLGKKSNYLPNWLNKRFSNYQRYWK